jgi:phosphohistidine swiveling domain-containing protein
MPSPEKTSLCCIAERTERSEPAPWVVGLETPWARCGSLVGAKAQRLGEMQSLGLPVPRGFCVTAAAYASFVAGAGLEQTLAQALAQAAGNPRGAAALAQAAFRQGSFPPDLANAIVNWYGALAVDGVPAAAAVRSSALDEDGGADSFAGVHSSFLDVTGGEAVLDAVRQCWASFWSETALVYRGAKSALRPIAGAVIVQQMVHADAAGVLFTADPIGGGRDRLIVEAVAGVGERLVSGEVTPTRYELDRNGVLIEGSPRPEDAAPVSPGFLKKLVAAALTIESVYPQPQDIEWAKHDGSVYLLQTRPISARPAPAADSPDPAVWTRTSIGERFPDPLMPLEGTFVADWVFAPGFRRLFQSMGAPPEQGEQVFRTFRGIAYLNQRLLSDLLEGLPPDLAPDAAGGTADLSSVPIRLSLPLVRTAFRIFRIISKRQREFARQAPAFELRCRQMRRREFDGRTADGLCADLAGFRSLISDMSRGHLESIAAAEILMSLAAALTAKWAPGAEMGELQLAIAGRRANKTYAMGLRFAALVDIARACTELSSVLAGTEAAAVPSRLRALAASSQAVARFLLSFNEFLEEFGHRTARYNLSHPRWRENPAELVQLIQSQLRASPVAPMYDDSERDRALASILKRASAWKRLLLRAVFRQTRIYCGALRENENHYITMPFPDLKRLLRVIATKLTAEGKLREPGDLYFFTMHELEETLEGRLASAPDQGAIAIRKRDYEAASSAGRRGGTPPPGGQPTGGTLHGTPASAGEATGRARILLEPAGRLDRGEILVTRTLNASWAPVLRVAAGVVTDVGGMLSHGAVITRELGVPAVVGVSGATDRIRNGQLLTVCGTRGEVRIESGDTDNA